jgi:GTP-binding protein YchF
VHAAVQFVDIGGLVEGASKGEGLGNRFLAHIREVDAIVYVLRAFTDGDVPGPTDPMEHLSVVELELCLADLETIEKQLERKKKQAKIDKTAAAEAASLGLAFDSLAAGIPLYRSGVPEADRLALKDHFLLTNRPVLAVLNIDDSQLVDADAIAAPVKAELGDFAEVLPVCVQLEAEAAEMTGDDRTEMLEALGLGEGALPRFVHSAYHLLGLRTFLTTGDKESRAWTFKAGWKAPRCAGVIHGDLERGFIRAETIRWDELLDIGSWKKAKDLGKIRAEGKDYEVQDGDVLEILHNS